MNLQRKYNVRPSIRAIMLYENMTGHSFMDIESHQEDIVPLVYCCLFAHKENNFNYTYEDAVNKILPPIINSLVDDFQNTMIIESQFRGRIEQQNIENNKTIDSSIEASPSASNHMFLTNIIPVLVKECGLDINYILDDMNYSEIDMYINYSIQKKRDEMEESRFWTFLTVLPHINTKKIKEPKDLIEFTWEKTKKQKKAQASLTDENVLNKLRELGILKTKETENKEGN